MVWCKHKGNSFKSPNVKRLRNISVIIKWDWYISSTETRYTDYFLEKSDGLKTEVWIIVKPLLGLGMLLQSTRLSTWEGLSSSLKVYFLSRISLSSTICLILSYTGFISETILSPHHIFTVYIYIYRSITIHTIYSSIYLALSCLLG